MPSGAALALDDRHFGQLGGKQQSLGGGDQLQLPPGWLAGEVDPPE
jgi:hypothetical protein